MPWNQSLSEFDSSATTEEENQTPETTPRAWWLTAKERTVYRRKSHTLPTLTGVSQSVGSGAETCTGFDEAVAYIHDFMINNPPFDVSSYLHLRLYGRADGMIGYNGFLTGGMYGRYPLFTRTSSSSTLSHTVPSVSSLTVDHAL